MTIRSFCLLGLAAGLGTGCQPDGRGAAVTTIDTVAAPDGVPMVYEASGSGSPALVFVHCWACDRTFWRGSLDALSRSYRVIAVDLPGHGESGRTRTEWSIPGLGADVAALVTALELPRVVLVGHSMGAPVALAAAARLRGRVAGVVCVDALHDAELRAEQNMIGPLLTAFSRDYPATTTAAVRGMFAGSPDTASANWVLGKALAADTAVALGLMRTYPALDFVALLADAGAPVRCINAAPGERAAMATRVDVNRKYADFDAVLVEGVGHYLQLEKPDEFNARLREIVERF
jgi:pimeloyl-ACP methyl ester carboxylesterase